MYPQRPAAPEILALTMTETATVETLATKNSDGSVLVMIADRAVLSPADRDRKSTRLNSSHGYISYAVFCLKKKKKTHDATTTHAADSADHQSACNLGRTQLRDRDPNGRQAHKIVMSAHALHSAPRATGIAH